LKRVAGRQHSSQPDDASELLVKALGGGWEDSTRTAKVAPMPTRTDVEFTAMPVGNPHPETSPHQVP
jgi:hypothetical protein